jgi:hypothetical protein
MLHGLKNVTQRTNWRDAERSHTLQARNWIERP